MSLMPAKQSTMAGAIEWGVRAPDERSTMRSDSEAARPVAYIRTSTADQANGADAQRRAIREAVAAKGWAEPVWAEGPRRERRPGL